MPITLNVGSWEPRSQKGEFSHASRKNRSVSHVDDFYSPFIYNGSRYVYCLATLLPCGVAVITAGFPPFNLSAVGAGEGMMPRGDGDTRLATETPIEARRADAGLGAAYMQKCMHVCTWVCMRAFVHLCKHTIQLRLDARTRIGAGRWLGTHERVGARARTMGQIGTHRRGWWRPDRPPRRGCGRCWSRREAMW